MEAYRRARMPKAKAKGVLTKVEANLDLKKGSRKVEANEKLAKAWKQSK